MVNPSRTGAEFDFLTATAPRSRTARRRQSRARSWIAAGASILAITFFSWQNFHSIRSESLLGTGRLMLHENPATGVSMIWKAYLAQPLARAPRRAMGFAIAVLQREAVVPEVLADKAHELAMSAGAYAPLTLFSRVEHLLISDRWKEENEEIEALLTQLKSTARLQATTWIVEARFALLLEDFPRAAVATHHGLSLSPDGLELVALEALNEILLIVRN